MYSLGLPALTSFLLALFLTPLVRNLFRRPGVVGRPDGGRHLRRPLGQRPVKALRRARRREVKP
jgi:UDP-N-acetylmuramyl pentapeptide phosphotransferase/UDP-N-acetylglucosamine-1-phosphate transferase